jgi:hypothetical protein
MPAVQDYPHCLPSIVTENDEQYLLVLVDGQEGGAWRFKIDVRGLVRLNAECAARLVTKVQRGYAYIKTDSDSIAIEGPK